MAHAFFPKDGSTHFDADEDWKFRSNDGTDLEIVAAHEFGHALGLGHSGNQKSLMVPYYIAPIPGWKLDYDDIRGIQTIYGMCCRRICIIPVRYFTAVHFLWPIIRLLVNRS